MEAFYPDIPRIYTAVAEICACLVYALLLKRRVNNVRLVVYTLAAGAIQSAFLFFTRNVPLALWIPCMIAAVFMMYLYLTAVLKASRIRIAYYCIRAFILAEFIASLEWQIACFFGYAQTDFDLMNLVSVVVVYTGVLALVYAIELRLHQSIEGYEITLRDLTGAALLAMLSFAFSNLSFVWENTPFSGRYSAEIFNIRTLVDFAGVLALYLFQSRITELHAEQEISAINNVLKMQYEKYRGYQESIDLINMKYHDLKHQIEGLRSRQDTAGREEWIKTLEQELTHYAPQVETGNSVLDTMIDARMITCKNHDIKLTAVAEGDALQFMHVTDICTVFGNALDNAIESVLAIDDKERRLIHLTVAKKKSFTLISVENVCDHPVEFLNGNPKTTKADKKSHGFGTKSIRYAAEKYGGTVSMQVKDGWFTVKILIPVTA